MSPEYTCPECGRTVEGSRMEGSLLVCPSCGSDVGPAGPPSPEPESEQPAEVGEAAEEEMASEPSRRTRIRKWAAGGTALLLFWLLATVLVTTVFSGAAIGSDFLAGVGLAAPWWHAALLVSTAPLWVLTVGLMGGKSAGRLCQVTAGVVGLALCLGLLGEAVVSVRSATEAGEFFSTISVEGLIAIFAGLLGFVVLVRFLLNRSSAGRDVGIASAAFAVFAIGRWGSVFVQGAFGGMQEVGLGATAQTQPFMTTVALAIVLSLTLTLAARSERYGWAYTLFSVLLAVLTVEAAGYTAYSMHDAEGWQATAQKLGNVAFVSAILAYLPVLVVGLVHAWLERGTLVDDLQETTRFAWKMAVPAAFFLLAAWLPAAQSKDPAYIHLWGICLGVGALLVVASLGVRGQTWINRWLVVPTTIGAVLLLCDSIGLLASLRQTGMDEPILLSGAGGQFLWLIAVIIGLSATAGMWIGMKGSDPTKVRESDAGIIYTAGWTLPTAVIALCLLGQGGSGQLQQNALSFLNWVGTGMAGGLADANLEQIADAGAWWFSGLRDLLFGGQALAVACVAGGMAVVAAVHVCAQAGSRSARLMVTYLWVALIAVAVISAGAVAFGAFRDAWTTEAGPLSGEDFVGPVVWCTLVAGLVWRLTDAARSVYKGGGEDFPRAEEKRSHAEIGSRAPRAFIGVLLALIAGGLTLAGIRGGFSGPVGTDVLNSVLAAWEQGKALVFEVTVSSVYWASFGVSVAFCVAFGLILHEDARQGHTSAYPWVAGIWTAIIVWLSLNAFSALQPLSMEGLRRSAGLVAALGLAWILLAATTGGLWVAWATHSNHLGHAGESETRGEVPWAARWLGTLGACLTLLLAAAILYNVFPSIPELSARASQFDAGVAAAGEMGQYWVDAAWSTFSGSGRWMAPAAVGGGIVLLLAVVHIAAGRDAAWGWWGAALLWTALLGTAVYGVHRVVDFRSMGAWDRRLTMAALAGGLLVFALFNITTRAWTHVAVRTIPEKRD